MALSLAWASLSRKHDTIPSRRLDCADATASFGMILTTFILKRYLQLFSNSSFSPHYVQTDKNSDYVSTGTTMSCRLVKCSALLEER